jgi:polyphosphate kinase 2 (PPK2 family)
VDDITVLDKVDLSQRLEKKDYKRRLAEMQGVLTDLSWEAYRQKRACILVFEGWDAAGKGGAIRRVTQAVDARLRRTISVAAPTDEELAHHYLWRFWRHVPRAGHMRIFDRSWYGRVLVERVEGLAAPLEWQAAYRQINSFEEQLTERGDVLLKFWVHISKDEQLYRFQAREQTPYKQHKITDEDWRNREKWDLYREAIDDMVSRTSTESAPWHLIPGDDKRFARVEVITTVVCALRKAVGG